MLAEKADLFGMKITFLGTGTSQGVPMIGCKCEVCRSTDAKDKRLRSALYIELPDLHLVIDAGPDFRQQMLRENIDRLDAILLTHEHKDHVGGLDDVRAFNYLQKKPMLIYAEERVNNILKTKELHYIVENKNYPGIPKIIFNNIENRPFSIEHLSIVPVRGMHHQLPVLGFKIHNFAYLTDMNFIAESEKEKLKNIEVLIINALQYEPHISHFTIQQALDIVDELHVKKAYFTHMSHRLGKHEAIQKKLPPHVSLAYDGLQLNL